MTFQAVTNINTNIQSEPLADLSLRSLARFANSPAIVTARGTQTYREILALADGYATKLSEQGCLAGEAVVARVGSGANFLALFLACLERRCVFVPFTPNFPAERVSAVAQQFNARAVVEEQAQELNFLAREKFADAGKYDELFRRGGFVRYTSGTTGEAKGVFVSHESAAARIHSAQVGLNLPQDLRLFWPMEMALHFVAVLPVILRQGGAFVLPASGNSVSYREAVIQGRANAIYASPSDYIVLAGTSDLAALAQVIPTHSVVRALSTTAPLPPAVALRFEEVWRVPVDQVYGIFELGIVSAQSRTHHEGVGRLMPDVRVSLRDELGYEVPPGTAGRVFIFSKGALDAYLDPLRTRAQILSDGWFETGDIGRVAYDGTLTLLGRAAAVIEIGSKRVYPEQVEALLVAIPGVAAARVFGAPDENLGEARITAEVVRSPGSNVEAGEILEVCGATLEKYAVPQAVRFVDAIALTVGGKIQRNKPSPFVSHAQ